MNAYVRERLAGAIVGVNAFQIRRDPIQVDSSTTKRGAGSSAVRSSRPRMSHTSSAPFRTRKRSRCSRGGPPPTADVAWRNRTIGDAFVFGVTAPYQIVQDYRLAAGDPLTDLDVRERRLVAVLGFDVAEKLFDDAARAVDQRVRVRG